MAKQKLSSGVRGAGAVLSESELNQIARQTGRTTDQVIAKAIDVGIGVGSKVINRYQPSTPSFYQPVSSNLTPLQNLTIPRGTAYYGSSTVTTPATQTRTVDGGSSSTPATTTYTPIVLPRSAAPGTAGGGSNGLSYNGKPLQDGITYQLNDAGTKVVGVANGNGSGNGNGNANDPYQDLRDQIDAAKQQILDLQNQQPAPYPDISQLLADQQASAAAQQQSFAAQAAQQQKALQDLMIQQQQAYETQMADARAQQERMAAQAAEAQRQALAMANAYVPGLEPSATAPALGDSRNRGRSSAANTLSNLSILTGMGLSGGVTATAAAPLAGLQIA